MSNNSLEIVHEGWLTKSPPSKPIWRARWRKRWFVLRHSGELPDQYFLEYYTDRNCRKLKGKIDLDQCEQVDIGLQFENSKQKYQFMFDVKTPKRTYFLAAESNEEMNKWVEYVCQVCRLIAYKEEDEDFEYGVAGDDEESATVVRLPLRTSDLTIEDTESPPVSPTSTTSGPYIPISECISGKPLSSPNGLEDLNNLLRQGGYGKLTATMQYAATSNSHLRGKSASDFVSNQPKYHTHYHASDATHTTHTVQRKPLLPVKGSDAGAGNDIRQDEFYDSPRQLHPHTDLRYGGSSQPTSPTTTEGDFSSVFTDDEWAGPVFPMPAANWETLTNADGENIRPRRPSESYEADGDIGSWSVVRKFGKLTVVDSKRFVPASVHGRRNQTLPHKPAPPRPPKPVHLLDGPSHNYLNLENVTARSTKPKSTNNNTAPAEPVISAPISTIPATETVLTFPKISFTPPVTPHQTETTSGVITDETYDFPRSHQHTNSEAEPTAAPGRHCYTNAAPTQVNGDVFRYDFHHNDSPISVEQDFVPGNAEEPTSPRSEGSSSIASTTAVYSNLPSPLVLGPGNNISPPPAVNRGLKPGRKLSDSTSAVSGSELSPGTPGPFPPSIDRKLKPYMNMALESTGELLQLAPPPDANLRSLRKNKNKNRAAPSPTPPSPYYGNIRNGLRSSSVEDVRNTQDEEIYFFQGRNNSFVPASLVKRNFPEIHYLDLEHDSNGASASTQAPKSQGSLVLNTTVYKKVDFLKTQAFNKTRQKVEEERKMCSVEML